MSKTRHGRAECLLVVIAALLLPSVAAAQPIGGVDLCSSTCSQEDCTPPPETVYEATPYDMSAWQDCDVCCMDATLAGTGDEDALSDKGLCAAADIVAVASVADCTSAIDAAFTGPPLKVCLNGHGAPGYVSMGAGFGDPNGLTGGDRDALDGASQDFFINETMGKVDSLHLIACSTAAGADGADFLDDLANGIGAHVGGFTKKICFDSDPAFDPNCFWSEVGGAVIEDWPEPHTVHDHVWSNFPVWWGAGLWTHDGVVVCTTFPEGTHTGGPGQPEHDWDWQGCPVWPNDWHWTAQFSWQGFDVEATWWFRWPDGEMPPIEVEIYCAPGLLEFMVDVDMVNDQYLILDGFGKPLHVGRWSEYPDDLPPSWEPAGGKRQSFDPDPLIFEDGFESGDTAAWVFTVPQP